MKVFRHKNGNLYTIQQVGRGKTITPPRDWKCFYATPYKTNKNAPLLPTLGEIPNLEDFSLEFEE
jgi:hypothetical protein